MSTTEYRKNRGRRSDAIREAEAVGISTDIRYCACGCGTPLKPDAKWTYVRGHRLAAGAKDQSLKDPNPGKGKQPITSVEQLPTLVKQDIQDKLDFLLTLIATGWETRDPLCGHEFSMRTSAIADKLIPIIARNPELMRWLTREGNVSVWLDLGIVLMPIGKMVVQHHMLHTIGGEEELNETVALSDYPV